MPFTAEDIRKALQEASDVKINLSASAAVVIAAITEYARKRGEDRSFDYWLEECILAGAKAKERSWDYGDKARNQREFQDAVKNSKIKFIGGVPATLPDHVAYAELCVKYGQFDVTSADVIALKQQAQQQAVQAQAVATKK